MCAFNSESFPESLAFATEESLTIGNIDTIQKLHIRSVPLGETPRRIAHQPSSNTFLVITLNNSFNPDANEVGFCRLIDDQTYETIDSFQLPPNERPCSIISTSFPSDSNKYFVVGTAILVPDEPEPSRGRILAFSVSDRKLKLISEKEVKGAVYSMCSFNTGLLAGINSKVSTQSLNQKEKPFYSHRFFFFFFQRSNFILG